MSHSGSRYTGFQSSVGHGSHESHESHGAHGRAGGAGGQPGQPGQPGGGGGYSRRSGYSGHVYSGDSSHHGSGRGSRSHHSGPSRSVHGETTRGGGAAGQSHRSVQSKTALGGASASHRPSQNRGLQCGNPSHIGPSNVDGGSASYRTSQIRTLQGGDPSHVSPSASTRLHQPSASEEFSYPFPLRYKAVALYNEKHPNSQATVPSYEVMASKFWSVSLPEGLLKAHSSIFDNFDIARDPNVTVEKWFRERYICTFVLLHALRRRMERQYDLSPPSDEELVEMDNWVAGHAQHLHMLLEDVSRV